MLPNRVFNAIVVLLFLAFSMVTFAQFEDIPEPTLSYQVCDWGLLMTELPAEPAPIFVEITSPADYSAVEGSSFTLSGTGAGLFEGNIIVEVTSADGDMLFEGYATLQAEELGAVGDWSIDVDLGELNEATAIFVTTYSTSPEDGSTVAFDSLRLNANSEFGLPFVEIESPYYGAGVPAFLMQINGTAGAAFENNIVIEVRDFATGDVLAETFATIDTDELAGSGAFSAEVDIEAEPGTEIEIIAYHPPVADDGDIEVSDVTFAVVNPLLQTYERTLTVRADDPILGAEDLCGVAESEFDNENIMPLSVNDVTVFESIEQAPQVILGVDAAGSSVCPAPLRTRSVYSDGAFVVEVYLDTTYPVPCTADLAPIPVNVFLGTATSPDFAVTVNGESIR